MTADVTAQTHAGDPRQCCDECRADLGQIATKPQTCPRCDGDGVRMVMHPRWGHPGCPEPETEVECETCGGRGVL